jgi:hypothetical protein
LESKDAKKPVALQHKDICYLPSWLPLVCTLYAALACDPSKRVSTWLKLNFPHCRY